MRIQLTSMTSSVIYYIISLVSVSLVDPSCLTSPIKDCLGSCHVVSFVVLC